MTLPRVEKKLELETKRVDLSTKSHEADTVVPARAERDAALMEAQGAGRPYPGERQRRRRKRSS